MIMPVTNSLIRLPSAASGLACIISLSSNSTDGDMMQLSKVELKLDSWVLSGRKLPGARSQSVKMNHLIKLISKLVSS